MEIKKTEEKLKRDEEKKKLEELQKNRHWHTPQPNSNRVFIEFPRALK